MSASDPVNDKESNVASNDDANTVDAVAAPWKGMSEYERSRAKNIAHLKLQLSKLEEQFPPPDGLQPKPVVKKSAKVSCKVKKSFDVNHLEISPSESSCDFCDNTLTVTNIFLQLVQPPFCKLPLPHHHRWRVSMAPKYQQCLRQVSPFTPMTRMSHST